MAAPCAGGGFSANGVSGIGSSFLLVAQGGLSACSRHSPPAFYDLAFGLSQGRSILQKFMIGFIFLIDTVGDVVYNIGLSYSVPIRASAQVLRFCTKTNGREVAFALFFCC
jgi:hypothetical protein